MKVGGVWELRGCGGWGSDLVGRGGGFWAGGGVGDGGEVREGLSGVVSVYVV